MNPQNPNPSDPDSATPVADPAPQNPPPNAPREKPPKLRKDYFELRIRIRYWWLWTALGLVAVVYPIAVIYTAFSMQFLASHGPSANYQKQWEATGCPDRIQGQPKDPRLDEWFARNRGNHLFTLDARYLSYNGKEILDDPICLGAKIALLVHKPDPWRYDIVDAKTQTVIISITPGK
ncbi:MAG: hypothetical protein RL710_2403 [Pseudomonadota bacterium]|jgi:hypothetical protein